jgi:hypothetical protein
MYGPWQIVSDGAKAVGAKGVESYSSWCKNVTCKLRYTHT